MSTDSTLAQDQQQQEQVTREPGEDPSEHVVAPNPRGWAHNNVAGVEYLTRKDPYEALIRFNEKPAQAIIDYMKDNGFRWNRDEQMWARPIRYDTAAQDRELGRRTYSKVVEMVLEQKGIAPAQAQNEGVHF